MDCHRSFRIMSEVPQSVPTRSTFYRSHGKRALDLLVTVPLILLLLPVGFLVGASVWLFLGRPIFFIQTRSGLNLRPFELIKFRSMRDGRVNQGEVQPDVERLTRFGKFLRLTSLDEIPELVNVLRGEMSLVGSRPLLMQYVVRYTPHQRRRHEVLPGITGWAQVNGRNSLPWEERFELDIWYVDHVSFSLDIKILLKTVRKTLKREGITEPGQSTMTEFLGSEETSPGDNRPRSGRIKSGWSSRT